MDGQNPRSFSRGSLSRRAMLRLLGMGGGGLALAACGGGTGTSDSGGSTGNFAHAGFRVRASGAKIPTGDLTLHWIDSGDTKATFFHQFFPAYTNKHHNIQVKYDGTSWNLLSQVVTLGIRNGTVPDVFELPQNVTAAQAVANGWVGPIDDIVPDWAKIKKSFMKGIFQPGITEFGGKSYGYPFASNRRFGRHLLFNEDLLKRAGYDPGGKTLTWDQFRAAARKCTDQGKGQYYGFIMGLAQSGTLPTHVDTLASMAGAHAVNGFDYKTGEYAYASDEYIAAIELFLAMKSDGSIFPGSVSLDEPGARGRMPQGVAAMQLQGAWNIPIWKGQNPSFRLGLNLPPQRDLKDIWPLPLPSLASDTWFYYRKTKYPEVIGDVFYNLSTLENQVMWAKYNGAGDPPAQQQALTDSSAVLDSLDKKALGLAQRYTVLAPNPAVRNPDAALVNEVLKPVTPNYNDTLVGLYTGQIGNTKQAMKALVDRSNAALDDAIAVAKQRGAKVSRSDWVFSDWDPRKEYTASSR